VDRQLALETYLDAFSSVQFAARLNDGVIIADLARAARTMALRSHAEPSAADLVLLAFAALTHDYAAAVPVGRRALTRLREDGGSNWLRLLWQGSVLALELWDSDAAYMLSDQQLRRVREAGALSELPLALSSFVPILVFRGELTTAAEMVHEAGSVRGAAGLTETAYGALTYGAWRGHARETRQLIELKLNEARSRREGIGIAVCEYARAVLCNGLGHYDEAVTAAVEACADPQELVVHNWGLAELVESATRTGRIDLATAAFQRLSAKARASGSDWALGMEARARGLVSVGDAAEGAFKEAIDHLGRAGVRADLARAHLLYGEWLRQAERRLDARNQLGIAHELFTAMDMEGFAERTRRGLLATGGNAATHPAVVREKLTPQEVHIARLARGGLTNPEIGARLFISARTVEWHLRKVFAKLGITSRRELRGALSNHETPGAAP
jgi:DNA-binding CsgD family transcriptional regulator/tetratricopeptide (TPR) repeat protein